jgi:hypothetical protein
LIEKRGYVWYVKDGFDERIVKNGREGGENEKKVNYGNDVS